MPSLIADIADLRNRPDYHGFWEDFDNNFVTGDAWTPLTADMTDAATQFLVKKVTGAAGGILEITGDATDNDEAYLCRTVNSFLFANNKPALALARIQYAEAATDDLNVIFGFLSTAAASTANSLLDNGGGPVASATMALIYKLDGGTVWRVRSQIGAAVGQTDTVTRHTAGGSSYQRLQIEVRPTSSTVAEVTYFIDEGSGFIQMEDANNKPIKHQLVYTNAVACGTILGTKAGSATAETLLCDYIAAYQKR